MKVTPFIKLTCVVLAGLILYVIFFASDAKSAVARPAAVVEMTIYSAPALFDYGEVLTYRIRLINRTSEREVFPLFFQVGSDVTPQKGPPYWRVMVLRPYQSRIITFRVMAAGPPPIPSTGTFCLTVWLTAVNVFDNGAFTCAYAR